MKRKVIILGISFVVFATVCTGAFIGYRYYEDVKDYKNVFQKTETVTVDANEENTFVPNTEGAEGNTTPEAINIQNPLDIGMGAQQEARMELAEYQVLNILFLGIDRTDERDEWQMNVYRTDTIIFASINLDTKKVEVISIPRDTYTYLADIRKMDKINHAYVFGGMGEKGISSTINAVNKLINYSKVNYYFALDMEPIPQIVDSLGGIELDVEIDMKSRGVNLSKGWQFLNGSQAFDYINWRYSKNGDIDRIFRQQKFAQAMFDKLKKSGQLVQAVKLVLDYRKNITTDMSTKQMLALATLMNDINSGDVSYYSIPGRGEYISGVSYWIPDEKETDEMLKKCFGK